MAEGEPQDQRPAETISGKLIVYMAMGDAGVYIDCPALGYGMGMPRASFSEESIKRSLQTIIKSNFRSILHRVAKGEQFSARRIELAQRYADEEVEVPLVFVQNFDVRTQTE